jgi:hypothetical protein
MAENIITPEFRAAFISVHKATSQKNADGTTSKPKFSIRAVFPADADLKQMKGEAQDAAEGKWGAGKVPKTMRSPFRLNAELDKPVPGIPDDWIVMTFSANEDRRPGVVDASLQDIIDPTQVYNGAWFRAQVRAFAYENAGNKGVSFGLQNVQKLRDGDPLGGANQPAAKVFEAFGTPAKTAGGMFD